MEASLATATRHETQTRLGGWEQESPAPVPPSQSAASATLHAVAGSEAFLTLPLDEAPRSAILMAGGDYLGLSTHPTVVAEAVRATRRYGCGTGAGGTADPSHASHAELERNLASLVNAEAALLFGGRYSAIVSSLSSLLGPGDLLLVDAPANEAIIDAGRFARARVECFEHADPEDLERRIRQRPEANSAVLVAIEGVYGFDGRLAPLGDIVAVARTHGAAIFVDDTHGLGVVGPNGRGSAEAAALAVQVDYVVACLGGFLGSTGAFVAGSSPAIESLRATSRGRHDAPPPPAASSVAAIAALGVFGTESELRATLWRNIGFVRDGLRSRKFDVGRIESALVPIPIGGETRMMDVKRRLLERGLYAAHIGAPVVDPALSRLRLTVKGGQSHDELSRALDILEEAGHEFGFAG